MVKPKWEHAYYLPEDKEDTNVDYVLKKRDSGTPIKEGDCWSSKAQHSKGTGLRLLAIRGNGCRSYFRAWPREYQTDRWREINRRAGISRKSISHAYRFHHLFEELLEAMQKDPELRAEFSIVDAIEGPEIGKRDAPDIVITHEDKFFRKRTLVSITDKYRKRKIDSSDVVFTLNIRKWTDDECTMFKKYGKPNTVKWWNRHVAQCRRVQNEKEAALQEEKRAEEAALQEEKRAEEAALQEEKKLENKIVNREKLWKLLDPLIEIKRKREKDLEISYELYASTWNEDAEKSEEILEFIAALSSWIEAEESKTRRLLRKSTSQLVLKITSTESDHPDHFYAPPEKGGMRSYSTRMTDYFEPQVEDELRALGLRWDWSTWRGEFVVSVSGYSRLLNEEWEKLPKLAEREEEAWISENPKKMEIASNLLKEANEMAAFLRKNGLDPYLERYGSQKVRFNPNPTPEEKYLMKQLERDDYSREINKLSMVSTLSISDIARQRDGYESVTEYPNLDSIFQEIVALDIDKE